MINYKIKLVTMTTLLILIANISSAEMGFYLRDKNVLVTEVDMSLKTLTYREDKKDIQLKFNMELLEDVYYKGTTEKYSLSKMPLNRKYYIRIKYLNEKDYNAKPAKMSGEVFYIGTVKYPF